MRSMLMALLCCLVDTGLNMAQAAYPVQPITLVVPFGAGSDPDQFARIFIQSVQRLPGTPPMVVKNQVGGSGTLASLAVQQSAPDGYTLLAARAGTHAVAPALDPQTPYQFDQFTVLAILNLGPLICAVRTDSPHTSIRDLLNTLRQHPGTLKYSTPGAGTLPNFTTQYLMSLSGIPTSAAAPLHFIGGVEAADAVLRGKADFTCIAASVVGTQIAQGQLRGLFTTAPGRLAALPQIPNAR